MYTVNTHTHTEARIQLSLRLYVLVADVKKLHNVETSSIEATFGAGRWRHTRSWGWFGFCCQCFLGRISLFFGKSICQRCRFWVTRSQIAFENHAYIFDLYSIEYFWVFLYMYIYMGYVSIPCASPPSPKPTTFSNHRILGWWDGGGHSQGAQRFRLAVWRRWMILGKFSVSLLFWAKGWDSGC